MFQLKRFLRPYLKQTIIGSVAKLVEAILELLLPLLMARIIDVGIHNMDIPYIWKTGILMLGVIIVGAWLGNVMPIFCVCYLPERWQ